MDAEPQVTAGDALDLLDWKRQVFALYERVRQNADHRAAWDDWCETRARLIGGHPQSPVPASRRNGFTPELYDYDPRWRVVATVADLPSERREIAVSTGGTYPFSRAGIAHFTLDDTACALELMWNEAYGGGIFVPFTDETTGVTTYGGGRYILDTVKGADLGSNTESRTLVLDFNFAYNPSCAYDPGWACPLAPPGNALPLALTGGERSAREPAPARRR